MNIKKFLILILHFINKKLGWPTHQFPSPPHPKNWDNWTSTSYRELALKKQLFKNWKCLKWEWGCLWASFPAVPLMTMLKQKICTIPSVRFSFHYDDVTNRLGYSMNLFDRSSTSILLQIIKLMLIYLFLVCSYTLFFNCFQYKEMKKVGFLTLTNMIFFWECINRI